MGKLGGERFTQLSTYIKYMTFSLRYLGDIVGVDPFLLTVSEWNSLNEKLEISNIKGSYLFL